jgi:hypothetical protein
MIRTVQNDPVPVPVEPARGRQTPDNDFGSMIERGARRALNVAGKGARAAVALMPGGSFVSALADTASSPAGLDGAGLGAGTDQWSLLQAQARLQEEGMANSLRLLMLQQKMQKETQTISAVSNVMKARHELAKTAINNIR